MDGMDNHHFFVQPVVLKPKQHNSTTGMIFLIRHIRTWL